jgi:iron complex outermembrane receptor protein
MQTFKCMGLITGLLSAWLMCGLTAPAMASGATFDIAAGAAPDTLKEFAAQAHLQLLFDYKAVQTLKTPAIKGQLEPIEALKSLLHGSGFTFRQINERTIAVTAPGMSTTWLASPDRSQSTAGLRGDQEGETGDSGGFRVAQADQGQTAGAPSIVSNERATNKEPVGLQEVVVTARKHTENLQDVPIAVSVVSAEALAQQGALLMQDYYATVPGLSITDSGVAGHLLVTMRGLSSGYGNPTVGSTIDDVPIGSSNTAIIDAAQFVPQLDPAILQRIEFLKGPQGTLYGASTLGGVIRYVTVLPDLTSTTGDVDLTGNAVDGGGRGFGVRGSVNMPVIADTLAIRVSAFGRRDPGYLDDPAHGEKEINSADVYGGHFDALLQATDNFSVRLTALTQRTEGNGDGTVDTDYSYRPISGDLNQDRMPGTGAYDNETQLYSATLKFDTGSVNVTSITSYSKFQSHENADFPQLDFLAGLFYGAGGSSQITLVNSSKFTQELRLSSPGGSKLEWEIGGFYTHEDNGPNEFRSIANNLQTGAPAGLIYDFFAPVTYEEHAGFANLTYHFTDRFSLELGARESHNDQSYRQHVTGPLGGAQDSYSTQSNDNSFTYLVTPQFRFSESLMAYASVTSGYQPGGPNTPFTPSPAIPQTFGPSTTVNYELGLKSQLFDHRVTINTDIFYIDWSKIQLTGIQPTTFDSYVFNGGSATSKGVEISTEFRPMAGLTLSATTAYIDAALTSNAGNGFPGVSGNPLPYSGKVSGGLSADERFAIKGATAFVGATVAYVGKRYEGFPPALGEPQQSIPSYAYGDVRAGIQTNGWTATVFLRNLTNERGILNSTQVSGATPTSGVWHTSYITPRTIGLSIAKSF